MPAADPVLPEVIRLKTVPGGIARRVQADVLEALRRDPVGKDIWQADNQPVFRNQQADSLASLTVHFPLRVVFDKKERLGPFLEEIRQIGAERHRGEG